MAAAVEIRTSVLSREFRRFAQVRRSGVFFVFKRILLNS
jgi:hypothetical protein